MGYPGQFFPCLSVPGLIHASGLMKALVLAVLAAVALVPSVSRADSPSTIVMRLLGIDGIPSDANNPASDLSVASISFGASQQGVTVAGIGAAAAKTQITNLTIQRKVDKYSPLLFLSCATAKRFTGGRIIFRDTTSGSPLDFFTIDFTPGFVAGYEIAASAGDDAVYETVILSFSSMKITARPIVGGALGTPVSGAFNVVTNKPTDFTLAP